VDDYRTMRVVGSSMDDSAGESFDKVAKMLGLGYPGGPVIETLAKEGDPKRFELPKPLRQSKAVAFSYSGLKNAVRLHIESLGEEMTQQDMQDIAASFQASAFGHIFDKLKRYFDTIPPKDLAVVGGVSANTYFREGLERLCKTYGVQLHVAPLNYCSDNAAMIGRAAVEAYRLGDFADPDGVDVYSRSDLEQQ